MRIEKKHYFNKFSETLRMAFLRFCNHLTAIDIRSLYIRTVILFLFTTHNLCMLSAMTNSAERDLGFYINIVTFGFDLVFFAAWMIYYINKVS